LSIVDVAEDSITTRSPGAAFERKDGKNLLEILRSLWSEETTLEDSITTRSPGAAFSVHRCHLVEYRGFHLLHLYINTLGQECLDEESRPYHPEAFPWRQQGHLEILIKLNLIHRHLMMEANSRKIFAMRWLHLRNSGEANAFESLMSGFMIIFWNEVVCYV
jgi:hypothetical protein